MRAVGGGEAERAAEWVRFGPGDGFAGEECVGGGIGDGGGGAGAGVVGAGLGADAALGDGGGGAKAGVVCDGGDGPGTAGDVSSGWVFRGCSRRDGGETLFSDGRPAME